MTNILCWNNPTGQTQFLTLLSGLTEQQRANIQTRYLNSLAQYKTRCRTYDHVYHIARSTVLISSLLVPALLSTQYNNVASGTNYDNYVNSIFWITWVLSLTVGILNGLLLLFRVEKKYFLLHIIMAQLVAEGYYYSGLTGRYDGRLTGGVGHATHQNQYVFFIHAVERILMREIDVEYFRQYDNNMNINIHNEIPLTEIAVAPTASRRGSPPAPVRTPVAGTNLYHPSPEMPIVPAIAPPPPSAEE